MSKKTISYSTPKFAPPKEHVLGKCPADKEIMVTVVLHRANPVPQGQHQFDPDYYLANHTGRQSDVDDVAGWAKSAGLTVDFSCPLQRRVLLKGPAAAMEKAFGVKLNHYSHISGTVFHSHRGPISVPDSLHSKVMAVLGLDGRPIASPHSRVHSLHGNSIPNQPGAFTALQLANLYSFPKPANPGAGVNLGILELGGGFVPADLKTYFTAVGLPDVAVSGVSVDNGHNVPLGNPNSADGEVMLDIEVAGSVAPFARMVVYFTPNTDAGFHDGIVAAAHDKFYKPAALSISWGGPEITWSTPALAAMNAALQDAAALGVTVTVAAGDNGSDDGVGDHKKHVDFPASSPYVLACGGTKLVVDGSSLTETVWNGGSRDGATGGGYSGKFPVPSWQLGVSGPGRGVPDVAGNADPASGFQVYVDGQWAVIGGTSAVAPLVAGLIVLLVQITGKRLGFINPTLYKNQAVFRDITVGNNGAFQAAHGWDACTGLGVPVGTKLQAVV